MDPIRTAFDEMASLYDAQRRFIIPEIEEFYNAAVWAVDWSGDSPEILDIGAGTGLLTGLLLKRFPNASVTLIDISEHMLAQAHERFNHREKTRYITGDYRSTGLGGEYDVICSALSIHHLIEGEKIDLYHRIYDALHPGGVFVNADQVQGETSRSQERFREYWDMFLHESPLPPGEMDTISKRRDTLDKEATLSSQIFWLRECGFTDLYLTYKNRMFTVFSGRKE
jgi:tRNA (cmo5U34)-methyltransferase